jgi:hypothetical protein
MKAAGNMRPGLRASLQSKEPRRPSSRQGLAPRLKAVCNLQVGEEKKLLFFGNLAHLVMSFCVECPNC